MMQGIEFVAYPVQDLARAVAFYRDVVGLKLLQHKEGKWAEFEVGDSAVCLYPFAALGEDSFTPAVSLTFRVPDVAAAHDRLAAHGVKFPMGNKPHDSGFCHALNFKDSEGNTVWLHHRYKSEAELAAEALVDAQG